MNKKYGMLMLAACWLATPVLAEDPPPVAPDPAAAESPAPEAQTAAATGDVAAGTIVFFRPKKMLGAAIGFKVREADRELGKLRNGTYFVLQVAPGPHEYVVHSEAKDVLAMEVEAGETYYVMGSIGMGVVAGRPNLSPSDKATFESMKDKLKEKPALAADEPDGD